MTQTYTWITPAGNAHPIIETDGLKLLAGATGRGAPPPRLTEDQVPNLPGRRLRDAVHDSRDVHWPALFRGLGDDGLRTSERLWGARFDPARGNGRLRVIDPVNGDREIACVVTDGLDGDDSNANRLAGWAKTVLTFHAPWPYAIATVDTDITFAGAPPPKWFPIFPLRLGSSSVFGTNTFTVAGEVDTWPVWAIDGPGDHLVLWNRTTDRKVSWDGSLGVGQSLTIDTRPAELSETPKRVLREDGSSEFGNLSAWDMWPLVPGSNTVDVLMSGSAVGSQVTCSYRPSYLAL